MFPATSIAAFGLAISSNEGAVHPSRLLVEPRKDATAREIAAAHALAGARVVRDLPQIGWQIVETAPGKSAEAREAYLASRAIERADFDRARRLAYTPNDAMWPGMWHMTQIRADQAWDTHKGAPSVTIGVLDTGLDFTHPDIAANVWTNPGEIPGNGLDDDGNGLADDVHGYDFAYGDPDPDDVFGHGTACAGIVAAAQDNWIGVTGVAPLCRVAGVKAALDTGYLYDSAVVPGLLYCADIGCSVISMSFFTDQVTPAERAAIDYCWSQGVLPVAASGNSQSVLPYYPGAYDRVLSVAATDPTDRKSWFSDWGTWVDVAAPGEGLSTILPGGGYTTGFAGTSGATPHVAGLAALLFAANPAASNALVRAAIEDTGVALIQAPYGEFTRYGRIDCHAALQRVLGATSGAKPPRLLFASPVGGGPAPALAAGAASSMTSLRFFGVGLEPPRVARVLRNGIPQPIQAQTRELVAAPIRSNLGATYALEIDGAIVGAFVFRGGSGWEYAATDASTWGGGSPVASGGWAELLEDDGQLFTCTRRDDGTVVVELAIRKVRVESVRAIDFAFTRAWTDCTGGTETIQFYDWSTWSYPYGTWVTVSSSTIASSATSTLSVPLPPSPARFIDGEGTLYVLITATNAGSAGQLSADSLRIRVR
jgi:subtilisin family serine protease